MIWDSEAERRLLATGCYQNFRLFAKYAFGIWGYHKPNDQGRRWWCEEEHGKLCDWLGAKGLRWLSMRDQPIRHYLLILIARDGGKTMLVTKAFQLWLHLHDPNLATVTDTATATKATNFAGHNRALLEGRDPFALFSWLYGEWKGEDLWTKDAYTHIARRANRSEPSFGTCSVETGVTGYHPDAMFVDDPIDLERLREEGNWVTRSNVHMSSIFPALLPNSLELLVTTPYVDGDPATRAITIEGIKSVAGADLPPEFARHVRADGKWDLYFLPGRTADGRPLLPRVWPKETMDQYEANEPANFASQIMLCPGGGEMVPLSWAKLEEMVVEPKDVPQNLQISFHCDTAFKSPERIGKGDESVIEVWGHHLGTGEVYYLEGWGSNRWKLEDFTSKLLSLVQKYKHRRISAITDEIQPGGKETTWAASLRQAFIAAGMFMPRFHEIRRPTNIRKEDRIVATVGYWLDGYVHLVRGAPGLNRLMEQMSRLTIAEKRDWADAAADVFDPGVYRPMHPDQEEEPPPPRRPYDEYLQTGAAPSIHDILGAYDAQREERQRETFVDVRAATNPYEP